MRERTATGRLFQIMRKLPIILFYPIILSIARRGMERRAVCWLKLVKKCPLRQVSTIVIAAARCSGSWSTMLKISLIFLFWFSVLGRSPWQNVHFTDDFIIFSLLPNNVNKQSYNATKRHSLFEWLFCAFLLFISGGILHCNVPLCHFDYSTHSWINASWIFRRYQVLCGTEMALFTECKGE